MHHEKRNWTGYQKNHFISLFTKKNHLVKNVDFPKKKKKVMKSRPIFNDFWIFELMEFEFISFLIFYPFVIFFLFFFLFSQK